MARSKRKASQGLQSTRPLAAPSEIAVSVPPLAAPSDISVPPVSEKSDTPTVSMAPLPPREVPSELTLASPTPRMIANSVTIEAALYVILFVAALISRFIDLGSRPLAENEASVAIATWQFLQGQGTAFIGSPFLFTTNLLLFFFGGPTDATVRIIPALVGSALVLLPTLLRRELGRTGALISSFLLLFSPTLLFFARDSNGVEVSVAAGFAGAIWIWRYFEQGRVRSLYLGVAVGAIALTASGAGYLLLLAGVAVVLLFRWVVPRLNHELPPIPADSPGLAGQTSKVNSADSRNEWRNAILLFGAIYVAVATAFTINRAGLSAALDLLGGWTRSFQGLGPLTSPVNLLPVYEPLNLVFGFTGLLLMASLGGEGLRSRGLAFFFGAVLVLATIVYSLSEDKSPSYVVVLVLPLAILAGWFMGNLLERSYQDIAITGGWRDLAIGELPILTMALVLTALIYLQLATLLEQNRFSPNIEALRQLISQGPAPGEFETAMILLGLFTLAVVAFLVFLAIFLIGSVRTSNLGGLVAAIVLALSAAHALWLANYSGLDTVNELIAGEQTSQQARDMVNDLEWLSQWRDGDPHIIPLVADEGLSPVVHWYLRGFKSIQWERQPQSNTNAEAVLTTGDAPAPAGAWIDQSYRLQVNWQPQDLTGEALWKWLLFRDGGIGSWKYVKLWAPTPE
jgi:uncharacterized protein (TIGR03663 family)